MRRSATALPLISRGRKRVALYLVLCLAFLAFASPIRPGVVIGESMSPAFRSGQVFLFCRLRAPARVRVGDVVLCDVGGQTYLKRVCALAGETVWRVRPLGRRGQPERIVSLRDLGWIRTRLARGEELAHLARLDVPPGRVFLVGDLLANSYDSRHFGPVPVEAIRGRVVVSRLFHLWRAGRPAYGVAIAGGEPPSAPLAAQKSETGRPGGAGRPVRSTERYPTNPPAFPER